MRVIAEEPIELFSHIGRALVVGENHIPDELVTYGLRRALERREAVGMCQLIWDEEDALEKEVAAAKPALASDDGQAQPDEPDEPAAVVSPLPPTDQPPQQRGRRRRRKR